MPTAGTPPPIDPTVIIRPSADPADAAARAREISEATARRDAARDAEAAAKPAQDAIIARERPNLQRIEAEITAAGEKITDKGNLVTQINYAQITRYTSVLDAEDAAVTAERARDDAEASLRIARGQLEAIQQYLQTTLPEFERTRIRLAEASRLFTEAETAHKEAAEADKDALATAKAQKSDEFSTASSAHELNANARIQLNDSERHKLVEISTKEGEHTALIEPATNKRAEATRLRREFDDEQLKLDQAMTALDTARREKASAEALRATTRETIERADAEQRRLRKATADAQAELDRLQRLPPPRARDPLDQTAQGDETLANRYNLSPDVLGNAGMADNFTKAQIESIIATFERQLKRQGAWGTNFKFEVSASADQIIISNDPVTGANASQIIIRPTLISFKGKVDDNTMQASLIAGGDLWGDAGIQIKSSSNSLKHGLVANAARLKELGRIKKYKASTWVGEIGEGFDGAKENVTAPRDTWTFGTNPFSHYNTKMHRIVHGADSHHDDPAIPVPSRTWFRDGPTTMAPQGPIPAAT